MDHQAAPPPPYLQTVCNCTVLFACAVALDATVNRLRLIPNPGLFFRLSPRGYPRPHVPTQHSGYLTYLRPAEVAEAAALRRRRLCCAVAAAALGALAPRLVPVLPGLALRAIAGAALVAAATSLLTAVRLLEIGLAAAGLRRFFAARRMVSIFRTAVSVVTVVAFAAAVWDPSDH